MTSIDRENAPRQVLREIGAGYRVYDYPKHEALKVAELAAAQFGDRFAYVSPSYGLAGQKVPSRYLEVRGSPFLNYGLGDGNGGAGVVAENESGDLALEIQVSRGEVETGDGTYRRWDTELRAPDWRLLDSKPELY